VTSTHTSGDTLVLSGLTVLAALAFTLGGCATDGGPVAESSAASPETTAAQRPATTVETGVGTGESVAVPDTDAPALQQRPAWLGTRVLERAEDGFGVRLPTPVELVDRQLPPPAPHPSLPAPADDGSFTGTVRLVDEQTAARSTWRPECPVALADLRHVLVTFVGFDQRTHTGELLVHHEVAEDIVGVFERLHAARFPLEEVRIITSEELDLPPTGDGNVTSAFVCRTTVGGRRWSEHAYGRAIDVNPFHNPYVRGDLVLPELAGVYVTRQPTRPGMIDAGSVVVEAFRAVGWRWGGEWASSVDWMHFSTTGR
jgi:hypothetical protein